MNRLLDLVRQTVTERYKSKLGLDLKREISDDKNWHAPVWIDGVLRDFSSQDKGVDADGCATIYDPAVGIVMHFVCFKPEQDVSTVIIRALTLRSHLQEPIHPVETGDEYGSWRVVLTWLVCESSEENWGQKIATIRETTGFSEELSFERILFEKGKEEKAIEAYEFPRLLLTLREVLGFAEAHRASQWLSADTQVKRLVDSLQLDFTDPTERELSRQIAALDTSSSGNEAGGGSFNSVWPKGKRIENIRIKDFRRIQEFALEFPQDTVKPLVIFGPNGTGKSSIVEAIALARFGTSHRYDRFCSAEEKDAGNKGREGEYVPKYLTPLGVDGASPAYTDGHEWRVFEPVPSEQRQESRIAMERNILTQEQSIRFTMMSAVDCALLVLRGYSRLADIIGTFVEDGAEAASAERQRYLRSLELSTAITKIETVHERVTEKKLEDLNLSMPLPVLTWLRSVESLPSQQGQELLRRVEMFREKGRIIEVAKIVSKKGSSESERRLAITGYIEDFNLLAKLVDQRISEIRTNLGAEPGQLQELSRLLTVWGEWISLRSKGDPQNSRDADPETIAKLTQSRARFDDVRSRGRIARERKTHLESTQKFLVAGWAEQNVNECPTCSLDVSAHGGIAERVSMLLTETNALLDELTREATVLRAVVEELQSAVAKQGAAESPLTDSQKKSVLEAYQWLTPSNASFERYIADPGSRAALIASAEAISTIPESPTERAVIKPAVDSALAEIDQAWEIAASSLRVPNAWEAVRGAVSARLTEIVEHHLPQTTELLWREIALAMTSSNWVNHRLPRMKAYAKRGDQRLQLDIDGRLPRYLLNQSEIHVLGLAWYFTDYLLKGRFEVPMIVLDDPAQEMDQTSFREFARFMASFVRLHRKQNEELTILLLLHQETRAFEIARSVRSYWMSLPWQADQIKSPEITRAYDADRLPPSPRMLVAAKG